MKKRLVIIFEALFVTALIAGFYLYSRGPEPDQTIVVDASATPLMTASAVNITASRSWKITKLRPCVACWIILPKVIQLWSNAIIARQ